MKMSHRVAISIVGLLASSLYAQIDPLIRMHEGYSYHQATAELIPIPSYALKYREHLNASLDQLQELANTSRMRTYPDQWMLLEEHRNRYIAQVKLLTRDQYMKITLIRYVEQPLHELLIAPSIQREIGLSDDQKEAIRAIYLSLREQKRLHIDADTEMKAVLSDQQIAHIERRRAQVPQIKAANKTMEPTGDTRAGNLEKD